MSSNRRFFTLVILFLVFAVSVKAEVGGESQYRISSTDWFVTGPIKVKSYREVCFPERSIDFGKSNSQGEKLWKSRPDFVDGKVHSLGSAPSSTRYLYREITVPEDMEFKFNLGSDDSIEFWVNCKKLLSKEYVRPAAPDQEMVTVKLQKGVNKVLLKIYNGTHGSGFYYRAVNKFQEELDKTVKELSAINFPAWKLSVKFLTRRYRKNYPNGQRYLQEIASVDSKKLINELKTGSSEALETSRKIIKLHKKSLVIENPVINFDKLLLVKRSHNNLGLPENFHALTFTISRDQYDNNISIYSLKSDKFTVVQSATDSGYIGEVDLHFNAKKMMFTGLDKNKRFQIFEKDLEDGKVRQVSPARETDIDSFDSIYLPDERIIFNSTTGFSGVPCHDGKGDVGNLHIMNRDGSGMRRLTFEQDHNWYPTLLPNGRVLYLRWEYTDSAHYFSRILMQMNPDGTGQREFYGSNSYWPNTMFYAKPLPGSTTKFVGIVSGHHGTRRAGELHLFDVSKGRREEKGVVQQIPGRGKKVIPRMADYYVDHVWPKFLHPYPINDKYFLVAGKMSVAGKWGLYLVDVYDNIVLIKEDPRYALFEPIPLKKTKRPPVIPDVVNLKKKEATCYIQNIYLGQGLRGVPKGTVKSLRIYQYEYGYRHLGGHYKIGMEGGWDVRRILGTVPVYEDGSAMFIIPANTPITIQPLDKDGRALQLMRSWMVGMPGEVVSCIGCHESQNQAAPAVRAIASTKAPVKIKPWYGPVRGMSFTRDVQPVLDKYCIGCHDGTDKRRPDFVDQTRVGQDGQLSGFPQSYMALHPYVRRNGPEGDYRLLTPLEFHVSTSKLIQMLEKGHHDVKMDKEGWDRLTTWIDMNVPCHGTWSDVAKVPANYAKRRKELKKLYAGVSEEVETLTYTTDYGKKYIAPKKMKIEEKVVTAENWPFSVEQAKKLQKQVGDNISKIVDLGDGRKIELVRVPAGEFVMGGDGEPKRKVTIEKPFWIGKTEVSLGQFRQFQPDYENGWYDMHYKDQVRPGYDMNKSNLPVIRVNWNEASSFCKWLSKKSGLKVKLPTEQQWEWACRAGTDTPLSYGGFDSDFSKFGNMADASIKLLAVIGIDPKPIHNPNKYWDYELKDARFNDGILHLADINRYNTNAWGIKNMHGNVAEWTDSNYGPRKHKTVRGGSWYDRPKRCTSSFRFGYPAWQKVFDVGFRVVIED